MKTLFRLLTLFMTVPIVELFFLIQVEKLFDTWTGGNGLLLTAVLIIATAVAGSYLAKREGLSAWNRLQGSLSDGGLPGDEILDAVIILIAGAFLITPGVLTDLIGFSGLIPLTRGWIRRAAKKRLKKAAREGRIQTSFGVFGGPGMTGAPPPGTNDPPNEADPEASETDGPEIGGTPSPRGPSAQDNGASAPSGPAPDDAASDDNERPHRLGDGASSKRDARSHPE